MKNLILLHGALGAASEFDRFIPLLRGYFNCFTFDLSGHGKDVSDTPFSMDQFADDLKSFTETHHLQKPQIFGYSMGGYVAYTLALKEPDALGDIMSLGTKLKWDPLIAKLETSKLNPEKIEEKVPKFAAYLGSLHLDWKANMQKTVRLMIGLGDGDALTFDDFSKIKNRCFIGLGDMDEMVSCQETLDVEEALFNSQYYKLPNSKHALETLNAETLTSKIIALLS